MHIEFQPNVENGEQSRDLDEASDLFVPATEILF